MVNGFASHRVKMVSNFPDSSHNDWQDIDHNHQRGLAINVRRLVLYLEMVIKFICNCSIDLALQFLRNSIATSSRNISLVPRLQAQLEPITKDEHSE